MELQPCGAIRNLLPDYTAGQLDPAVRAVIEAHLAVCDRGCPAEAREWRAIVDALALASPTIPTDTGAARDLVAIRARLGRTAAGRNTVIPLKRSTSRDMPDHDPLPTRAVNERGAASTERGQSRAPVAAQPSRRGPTWMAGGAVACLLVLAASLFYLFAPQFHPVKTVTSPTATPASARSGHGSWHTAEFHAQAPADVAFARGAPQIGYLCSDNSSNAAPSSQWLFKTTNGGATWMPVNGLAIPAEPPPIHITCNVFIDASDASDVFVQVLSDYAGTTAAADAPTPVNVFLWRSRDAGVIWTPLSVPQSKIGWADIVVTGSRILAMANYIGQVGPICGSSGGPGQMDDLYASDDGGATWKQIGQSLTAQGLSLTSLSDSLGPILQNVGAGVVVTTFCQVVDTYGTAGAQQGYWRSVDGGVTWARVDIPGQFAGNLRFTVAPGGAVYGVAAALTATKSDIAATALLYSDNGGQTWSALPDPRAAFTAQPAGWATRLDWMVATPDGAVLASMLRFDTNNDASTADAGVYWCNPRAARPVWSLYAPASLDASASYEPIGDSPLAAYSGGYSLWSSDQGIQPPQIRYLAPLP